MANVKAFGKLPMARGQRGRASIRKWRMALRCAAGRKLLEELDSD